LREDKTLFQKPPRLRPGDTVAVLSPSWIGPSVCPVAFLLRLVNFRARRTFRLVEVCVR